MLKNEKGEASYISVFIYILVAVILIAFIINVFRIISAKQQMDHAADQLVKQIQLGGSVNGETDALFAFLSGKYQVPTSWTIMWSAPIPQTKSKLAARSMLPLPDAAVWAASGISA